MNENLLNEAFATALLGQDEVTLIRLMGKTGVILDHLERETCVTLAQRVVDVMSGGDFVDFLLPWMFAFVDC